MSASTEVRQFCKIVNKHGLHTRSAAAIVQLANQYPCSITLSTHKGTSDARDMLRLMLLEASKNTEVCVSASGENAQEAVMAMSAFIEAGFNEMDDDAGSVS